MAQETFYADASDWTSGTDGTQEDLIAEANEFGSFFTTGYVYFDVLDTIAGGTITGAEFFVYNLAYTKTGTKPTTSDHGAIYIYTNPGGDLIDEFTAYPGDDTWWSVTLDAGNLAYIGNGTDDEDYDTMIYTAVDNPGTDRTRKWTIEAFDHADDHPAYLVVDYTPAAGGTARAFIIGG